MQRQTVVETTYGKLQGYFNGRCRLFAGIPYAAPPTGERRFRPPQPPAPWTGVRDATYFGPIQPQSPSRFEKFYGPDRQPQSEDSLLLNVWTPATDAEPRPVVVFIHGGAFVSGSGSLPMYHGEAFAARHGLVAVTLNYRLAEGGSLYLGHLDADYATSGNTALLDLIAALEWIRDNIAAFGGDPGNVTICGQSAGGHLVLALMAAPRARGLLHRAISMSLARLTPLRTIAEAIETTERFLALVGVRTVAELQRLSLEALLAARGQTMRTTPPWQTPWGTLVDDVVIPEQPLAAAAAGRLAPVPLLIGACRDDYRPYPSLLPPDTVPQDEAAVARLFDSLGIDGARLVRVYGELRGAGYADRHLRRGHGRLHVPPASHQIRRTACPPSADVHVRLHVGLTRAARGPGRRAYRRHSLCPAHAVDTAYALPPGRQPTRSPGRSDARGVEHLCPYRTPDRGGHASLAAIRRRPARYHGIGRTVNRPL